MSARDAAIREIIRMYFFQSAVLNNAELNTTPVAGANDTTPGTGLRLYTFFTMPTAATLYRITGFEWLNGTVVNGNTNGGIEYVDANPPVSANTTLALWIPTTAQSGTGVVQRVSSRFGGSTLIPAGAVCGAFIVTASATGRYGTTTVGSANNSRVIADTSAPAIGATTAWTAGTEEPYIKVYYKPVV